MTISKLFILLFVALSCRSRPSNVLTLPSLTIVSQSIIGTVYRCQYVISPVGPDEFQKSLEEFIEGVQISEETIVSPEFPRSQATWRPYNDPHQVIVELSLDLRDLFCQPSDHYAYDQESEIHRISLLSHSFPLPFKISLPAKDTSRSLPDQKISLLGPGEVFFEIPAESLSWITRESFQQDGHCRN